MKLLTVPESAKWAQAKNVFNYLHSDIPRISELYKFNHLSLRSRLFPLLVKPRPSSEALKRSVIFRSVSFWDSLPKHWEYDKLFFSALVPGSQPLDRKSEIDVSFSILSL